MKKAILSMAVAITTMFTSEAQTLVNASLETWVQDSGWLNPIEVPAGWNTSNIGFGGMDPVNKDSAHAGGMYSASLTPISIMGQPVPGYIGQDVPTTTCTRYLNFSAKGQIDVADSFIVAVSFYSDSSEDEFDAGEFRVGTISAWTPYYITLDVPTGYTFDTISLAAVLYGPSGQSKVWVDEFSFSDSAIGTAFGPSVFHTGLKEFTAAANPLQEVSVYPNPVREAAEIRFTLKEPAQVNIDLYDISGRKVKHVISDKLMQGEQHIPLEGVALNNGLYFCEITAGSQHLVTKVMVSK